MGLPFRERDLARRRLLVLGVGFSAVLGAVLHGAIGETESGISYQLAGLTLPAALLLPIRSGQLLQRFTQVSLGVYASHPFVDLGFKSLVNAQSAAIWVSVPIVFAGAVTFSTLLRKVAWGKAVA